MKRATPIIFITFSALIITLAALFVAINNAESHSQYVVTNKYQIKPSVLREIAKSFPDSDIGHTGERGEPGGNGSPGKEGKQGIQGKTGPEGEGRIGPKGDTGPAGPSGPAAPELEPILQSLKHNQDKLFGLVDINCSGAKELINTQLPTLTKMATEIMVQGNSQVNNALQNALHLIFETDITIVERLSSGCG